MGEFSYKSGQSCLAKAASDIVNAGSLLCNHMEIVKLDLGAPGEKGCTALGLLNTVFSKGLDLDERRRRVEEDYKIKVGQSF